MLKVVHSDPLDELAALDSELADLNLEGHWRLTGAMDPEPTPAADPYLWKWSDIRRALIRAGEIRAIEGGASRRTVRLCTPQIPGKWTTPTVHGSVQLVKPGEIAEAHRHTMSALRFIIEGRGGFTTVNGEKFWMEKSDLILTPNWTWHDHGHEGDVPTIWLDGHDLPLLSHIGGRFLERYSAMQQTVIRDASFTRMRSGAMRPISQPDHDARLLPYIYKGEEALDLLRSMTKEEVTPLGTYALDYVNPLTGGYTMPTIACRLSRLPAGKKTRRWRTTENIIYQIVDGEGVVVAGGQTFNWSANDVIAMPGWTWHEFACSGDRDAYIFNLSDEPVMAAALLLRSEFAD